MPRSSKHRQIIMKNNPYLNYVVAMRNLTEMGRNLPQGDLSPAKRASIQSNAGECILFSPHPDDECIIGGAARRMALEMNMKITNVPVTLGSNRERQLERLDELKSACELIGFDLLDVADRGFENVSCKTRSHSPGLWAEMVSAIVNILEERKPRVIFLPHDDDYNSTHIGVHHLVMDSLWKLPHFECFVIEWEFWKQMSSPNLMIELSDDVLADLIAAISCHKKEVARNPYHVNMTGWTSDNVRRGAEVIGGQGGVAPKFNWATLYRLGIWSGVQLLPFYEGGRVISCETNIAKMFA